MNLGVVTSNAGAGALVQGRRIRAGGNGASGTGADCEGWEQRLSMGDTCLIHHRGGDLERCVQGFSFGPVGRQLRTLPRLLIAWWGQASWCKVEESEPEVTAPRALASHPSLSSLSTRSPLHHVGPLGCLTFNFMRPLELVLWNGREKTHGRLRPFHQKST